MTLFVSLTGGVGSFCADTFFSVIARQGRSRASPEQETPCSQHAAFRAPAKSPGGHYPCGLATSFDKGQQTRQQSRKPKIAIINPSRPANEAARKCPLPDYTAEFEFELMLNKAEDKINRRRKLERNGGLFI